MYVCARAWAIGDIKSTINHLSLHFIWQTSCKANFDRNEAATDTSTMKERPTWANKTEFLMSCIQTSVGLGNIWRFPFTAYENGGGAFLIPYVIVLFVVGKPMYYLESYLGQFVSQSSIKVWELNPAFRGELHIFKIINSKSIVQKWIDCFRFFVVSKGVGAGQLVSSICVITYYSSLVALTVYYFFASFSSQLPWSQCQPEWGSNCVDSKSFDNSTVLGGSSASMSNQTTGDIASSSEMYFLYVFNARKSLLKKFSHFI